MAADGDPIRYACVADNGEILVGIMSGGDADDDQEGQQEELAALAARCVAAAPAYHRHYHHTARGRSYGFLIDGSFVYFAIYGGSLGRAPALLFLRRVRSAFLKSAGGADFAPRLRYLMQMPPSLYLKNGEDHHLAHRKEGKVAVVNVACGEAATVFGRPVKYEKISRELSVRDTKMDSDWGEDSDGERGSFSEKGVGGGGGVGRGRERARRVWRRHVKVVLVIDFLVCLVLFGVWLSICNGFQCITD